MAMQPIDRKQAKHKMRTRTVPPPKLVKREAEGEEKRHNASYRRNWRDYWY